MENTKDGYNIDYIGYLSYIIGFFSGILKNYISKNEIDFL